MVWNAEGGCVKRPVAALTVTSGMIVHRATMRGSGATSVRVPRGGVRNSAPTPGWKLQALDASGAQVGTAVGEGDIERGNYMFPSGPQDYTITAPGIKRLRFASNNNQSTFAAVPFTRISVTMVK